jgi:hypothetical protein
MLETTIDAESRGGAVTFTVRVTNHGEDPVELQFSDSQRVRVTVYPEDDEAPTWRSDEGRMFAQMLGSERVPAGEELVFEEVWEDPEVGEYRAVADVVSREADLRAETTFAVSP